MKKNLFFIALGATIMAVGCSKENGVEVNGIEIPKAVIENFEKQYPNASNVKWSKRSSYIIAQFDLATSKAAAAHIPANTVWYNDAANCIMEELDIPVSKLPQPIQDALKASKYATCEVDDIDVISRDGFTKVYVIEVEGKTADGSSVDIDLYFSEDGILLREVPDSEEDDDSDEYDSLISEVDMSRFDSFIKERFGDYRLIEADVEDDGSIEIEIVASIDEKQVKVDVVFGRDGKFIYDVYEIEFINAPDAIKKYIGEKYADQDVDEIDIARTADGKTLYVFEIELEVDGNEVEKDIILQIDEKGAVVEVTDIK